MKRKRFLIQTVTNVLLVAILGVLAAFCLPHSDVKTAYKPYYRGEEITEKVFEAHAAEIFDEAENRLHAQKAVMVLLMK